MIAVASIKGLGGSDPDLQYNNAIPLLMGQYFPNGMLGLAVAGLLAAFMAGGAADVSAVNTGITYDPLQAHIPPRQDEEQYLPYRRRPANAGHGVSIATPPIPSGY